ncbi:MAG TPA: Smr/MutS family protein [Gemmatimonadales bacterium]|nr:Smr/MutS family protein [Gemmatimonadales bacterium]
MPRPRSPHPRFDSSDDLLDGHPAATLDLHGFSAAEAEPALKAFLGTWRTRQPGALLHVITGRGRGSKGAPVLKPIVKRVLKNLPPSTVRDWAVTLDEGGYRVRLY